MHRKKKRNRKKEIEKDGNDDDQDDDEELERNRNTTPMAIGVLLGAPKTERLGSLGLWSLVSLSLVLWSLLEAVAR